MVKNLPGNAGDVGLSLDWEDSLEKEVVTHSSILAWKSQGQRSLTGYSHGVTKTRTGLKQPRTHTHIIYT